MVNQIADFCAQVDTVNKSYPMQALNDVNYDKTRIWFTSEGQIHLEHAGRTRAQKKD